MVYKYLKIVYGYFRNKLLDAEDYYHILKAKKENRKIIYGLYARVNNFGDQFNKDLLRFFNCELIYVKSYKKSQAAFTGSILGNYPRDYNGYVLGAGFLLEKYDRRKNNWNVQILRGPLSAGQCSAKNTTVFGDPGILASMIYRDNVSKKYRLGIVPHGRDVKEVTRLFSDSDVLIIQPRRTSKEVARDIKTCEYIASSSLHGLIFADSFRIPNVHLKFSDKLKGGLHKFKDYYLGMESLPEYMDYEKSLTTEKIIQQCKLRFSDNYLIEKQKRIKNVLQINIHKLI